LNFPFYIAKRYLVSHKSHNIINVISGISVVGVAIGVFALIVVLSVFNGFESVIKSLFNSFDPDIQIVAVQGKTFNAKDFPSDKIKQIPGVANYIEVVEENALLKAGERQYIARIKGVSKSYSSVTTLDTMMVSGRMLLQDGDHNYAVLGYGVAYYLNLDIANTLESFSVYVPKRNQKQTLFLNKAFNVKNIIPQGIFSVQQDIDTKFVLVPLRFARELLEYNDELTSVELYLDKNIDADDIQKEIKSVVGDKYKVKNRYQQQELLYKIMKSEKWAIYLILTFILIIATFNVIGSLSMIMIDKRDDISYLWSMGADINLIKKIFLTEGMLISTFGAVIGLVLGSLVCWAQQAFGFITLNTSGSFVISAYPVEMQVFDFVLVIITVLVIGFLAALYPVNKILRNYFDK